ncbi:hypothetical protein PQE20_27060 (plasmid) [Vibrio harveyi]|uniref:hypothetical protein n=1 Tax=Vibrio harveyi TaxID=669 RepID=UPI00234D9717|nr:hypothetical protein [Vibrio harveyi]MCV3265184.1 hypothetical protein [Vibrio harveyi]WCP84167.1 hypothetical protein PQE20_27060 [Vibrio harveyi]HDM8162007.1 hypothetical protein [Vibrio harveyi]
MDKVKLFIHAETDIANEIEPKLKFLDHADKDKILGLCKTTRQTMRNHLLSGFCHFNSSSTVVCDGKTITIRGSVNKLPLLKRLFGG